MMVGMDTTFVGRRIKRGAWLRDAEEVADTLAIAKQDQRGCPHAVRLVDALGEIDRLRGADQLLADALRDVDLVIRATCVRGDDGSWHSAGFWTADSDVKDALDRLTDV